MNVKKNANNWQNKTAKFIFICYWIIIAIHSIYKYNYDAEVLKNYDVTTGTVTHFYGDRRFYYVEIEYEINDMKYKTLEINYPDNCRLWDQYKMKYAVEDPKVIEVLWDEKIVNHGDCSGENHGGDSGEHRTHESEEQVIDFTN